jgi:hypothetical protein
MSSEATPDTALDAPGIHGELFLSAHEAETSGQRQAVPDESEAAMGRLRTPFDVGPADAVEPRG